MDEQHLTVQELLTAIKYCKGYNGTTTCEGCPNAIPGTENEYGLSKCRFDVHDEMVRILEQIVRQSPAAG